MKTSTNTKGTNKMDIETIAMLAYQLNKSYCESIGDFSFTVDWKDAPQWQKDTNVNGVKFHLSNPDATPSSSHENWLKVKEQEGWAYGPVKDVEKKLHPCYVRYEELPQAQQIKDYLFRNLVHTLAPFIELVPNAETIQAMENARNGVGMKRTSVKEMLEELDKED